MYRSLWTHFFAEHVLQSATSLRIDKNCCWVSFDFTFIDKSKQTVGNEIIYLSLICVFRYKKSAQIRLELKMTVTEHQAENTIPTGKYTFIGVDIDTTGRRILDEVRALSANCSHYSNFFDEIGFFSWKNVMVQATCRKKFNGIPTIEMYFYRLSIWPRTARKNNSISMWFRWWI